jgi:hypothetical protein
MSAKAFVLAVIAGLQLYYTAAAAPTFERVSVASDGTQGNSFSSDAAITPDGRFVAFDSASTNLVAGDTNGRIDVFVRDRLTGITTRESVGSNGVQGNSTSLGPSISADGRFVSFYSFATNFVAGTTAAVSQVYVRDRLLGVTMLASASPSGSPGDKTSFSLSSSLSSDGRFVTFYSAATNLVAGDTNAKGDVFTRELSTGAITRDSVAADGTQANSDSSESSLSSDGRYVVFSSYASNLVAGGTTPGRQNIFIRDRSTGQTTLESTDTVSSYSPSISGDGRFLSFIQTQFTLLLRDRQSGQLTTVSAGVGLQEPRLSPDGHYLVFVRDSPNPTVVAYDRLTGQTLPGASGFAPVVGLNAAAFTSSAALVPQDTNGTNDVYVFGEPITSGPSGPPSGLTASSSGSTVTLTWNAPSTGAPPTSYVIEAGSSPGAANLANFSTGSTATSFSTSGVAAGTYYVRVRASTSGGVSAPSNEVTLMVGGGCTGPAAPSNLAAAVSGSTVTLTWAAGNGATSYLLLVGSGPGRNDLLVGDLGSAATMLTASNVTAGTYFVRVQALNACGQSGPSNEAVVTVR